MRSRKTAQVQGRDPTFDQDVAHRIHPGRAGSISLATVEPDTLIFDGLLTNLGWWNGNSPEHPMDVFKYCLAVKITHRACLKLMTLTWVQFIGGSAWGYESAMASASASATDKRREVFGFLENCLSAKPGVAVKTGADVTAENLKDKGIGALQGNLGTYWVTNTVKPSAEVSQYQGRHGGSRR